ncbi:ciliary microtubule inner protein 5 [Carettochelys insculpta]|uniref:ciliary microtubule inner protein 5 n=1 Tax=Carettochelys insculpta TaxID=44489 RepID=UPI003EB769FC
MGSRSTGFRRTTSAGYQLPAARHLVELTSSSSPSLSTARHGKVLPGSGVLAQPAAQAQEKEQATLQKDQVQQDKIWREFIEAEWRGRKYWYQNWGFLKDYDPMGKKKEQEQLPEHVPVFSNKIPNTTNQIIGSRMNTEIGKTLVKMDYFLSSGRQKKKPEHELQPS